MADMYPVLESAALAPGGATEVGSKAWNPMRMAHAKLPVPAAFVLSTAWCGRTDDAAASTAALADGLRLLEAATGLVLGGTRRPLLVSVSLQIDLARRRCRIGTTLLNEGDLLALDGNTGAVYGGKLSITTERPEAALKKIASWQRATSALNK